ncbi:MAG: hypothetical protein IKB72_02935 [Ruminococcus sp.]|nr:hypothetical protein [Oscillospiraceae bacterium]MBR2724376.1 hypothetical protein [Ruminococcus sp.]
MQVEMISWITFLMGIFLMIVGIVIWAGKKIELVHGEDSAKVYDFDKASYAKLLGIGVILISFAVIAYGVLSCFPSVPKFVHWIAVGAFGGAGILILFIGHKKYFHGDI